MRRSVSSMLAAVGVAVLVSSYFIVRAAASGERGDNVEAEVAAAPSAADERITEVVTAPVEFETREVMVSVSGRTEARRSVVVRSQTSGVVAETPIEQGASVSEGDVLCRLEVDARAARLADARASLAQADIERTAAEELARRGHRAPTSVAAAQAAYDRAAAQAKEAEIAIGQTRISAPFAGVFDERIAEVGDYLGPGDPCGVVAEVDPILVVGELREHDVGQIDVGAPAKVALADGPVLDGRVRFVQWRASPETRTFKVEIEAPNPGGLVRAGRTARASLAGPPAEAALAPTGLVVLDDAGRLGLRVLDPQDVVRFRPVTVIEDTAEGVWVSGLAPDDRLIVRGHEYVVEGTRARSASAAAARTAEPGEAAAAARAGSP